MTELDVYGEDGIFHNVVKASKSLQGRYAVLETGAHDLNMNNLLSMLDIPKETNYPGVFCLPPVSDLEQSTESWEVFNFRLLFLCQSYTNGRDDRATNSSMGSAPMDWSAMKSAAINFFNALEAVQKKSVGFFRLSQKMPWRIIRITKKQNDNLSGVMVMFSASLATACEFGDINTPHLLTALFGDDGRFILNRNQKIIYT